MYELTRSALLMFHVCNDNLSYPHVWFVKVITHHMSVSVLQFYLCRRSDGTFYFTVRMLKPFILTPALLDSTSNHFISQVPALLCIRWVKMNNTLMNLVGLGNSTRSHPKLCTVWSCTGHSFLFTCSVHRVGRESLDSWFCTLKTLLNSF